MTDSNAPTTSDNKPSNSRRTTATSITTSDITTRLTTRTNPSIDRTQETTEQRFVRLLKEKKYIELQLDEERASRVQLKQQYDDMHNEYIQHKLSTEQLKLQLSNQYESQLYDIQQRYESEKSELVRQHESTIKIKLQQQQVELVESEQRSERLKLLTQNELERNIQNKLEVTYEHKHSKYIREHNELLQQERSHVQYLSSELETYKHKYNTLDHKYIQLQHNNDQLIDTIKNKNCEIAALNTYKHQCYKYNVLLKYMSITKYVSEYKLRKRLTVLHSSLNTLIEYIIQHTSGDVSTHLTQQAEVQQWYQQSLQLQQQTNKLSRKQARTASHHTHTRHSSVAGYQDERTEREKQKNQLVQNYQLQHSNKIITHCIELESIMKLCVHTIINDKTTYQITGESFFERNNELTNICMKLESNVQSAKSVVEQHKQLYQQSIHIIDQLLHVIQHNHQQHTNHNIIQSNALSPSQSTRTLKPAHSTIELHTNIVPHNNTVSTLSPALQHSIQQLRAAKLDEIVVDDSNDENMTIQLPVQQLQHNNKPTQQPPARNKLSHQRKVSTTTLSSFVHPTNQQSTIQLRPKSPPLSDNKLRAVSSVKQLSTQPSNKQLHTTQLNNIYSPRQHHTDNINNNKKHNNSYPTDIHTENYNTINVTQPTRHNQPQSTNHTKHITSPLKSTQPLLPQLIHPAVNNKLTSAQAIAAAYR